MPKVTFGGNPVTVNGNEVKVGDQAPSFKVLANDLSEKTFDDFKGVRLICAVPSLDTGVCDSETRRFNEEAGDISGVTVLTISADLPFAQARWCGASGLKNVVTLSDHRDLSFGKAYGVVIEELRLLSRAVFVVDSNDKVTYVEYVGEVTNHPNYEAALAAVMGHEVIHAVFNHGNERMSQGLIQQLGGVALAVAVSSKPTETQNLFLSAYGLGSQVGVLLPFSRKHELEADRYGLILTALAGYNPQEAIALWQRMERASANSSKPPEFLSTHPTEGTRIEQLQRYMPEAMKYYKPMGN